MKIKYWKHFCSYYDFFPSKLNKLFAVKSFLLYVTKGGVSHHYPLTNINKLQSKSTKKNDVSYIKIVAKSQTQQTTQVVCRQIFFTICRKWRRQSPLSFA